MEITAEPTLFPHGIQTENSDIRAHVSVVCKRIFVFQTKNAVQVIRDLAPQHPEWTRTAKQKGIAGITARGYAVPIEFVQDVRSIAMDPAWSGWGSWTQDLSTSERGEKAVKCVCGAIKRGLFPFWLDGQEDRRENIQIKGTDIVIFARKKIQVKCDFTAGPKHFGGSGNLFLQTSERNPLKMI